MKIFVESAAAIVLVVVIFAAGIWTGFILYGPVPPQPAKVPAIIQAGAA